jgi:hypothetical protein
MATKDETPSFRLDVRESQTTNLFVLQDLEDARRTKELTEISAALGRCAPLCPWLGNIRLFGLLLSGAPPAARQRSSSS